MNADEEKLAEGVKRALVVSGDLRGPQWRDSANALAGHCYVASEAFFHLTGGPNRSPWRPLHVEHEGQPHWFLKHRVTGEILDLTAAQFGTPVPYDEAQRKGFLTRQPSKRCRVLVSRMKPGSSSA